MPTPPAPAFRLYLLRHAKAGWALPGQKDFDRSLDDTGFAAAKMIGEMAAERGFVPEVLLSSPAVRCRQTAEAFRCAMGEDRTIRYIDALYTGAEDAYRDIILGQSGAASLMVVGHNPVIEEILREVLGEQAAAIPYGYPPGALAVIDFPDRPQAGILPPGKLAAWLDPACHAL
ncbi:SixA phosphatase family protein [Rhizobium giardinii]|uniref:Phosphohistidine phosphatase n=1 Tax=Rhizobium giardinii TaxID=56731 RepID=A0A7W8U8M6_9HYPH|nr:histidine phosphatase family protein [Rhizobium giardinii]MBB5534748.1 phosphohistidine phosphatase [Rhizobium giardinii]